MKISDIHVDGFGVWSDVFVDALPAGITLFYGPNEAGKTTLMQFIRAVLYGFSPERRKLYLPPVYGGGSGGTLRVENHSGEFTIERRLDDEDEDRAGRAVVLSSSGGRQGQHLLNVLVSGIDESIFNNVFAVGIRELQELATLNDTQAAEQLYNLASGVDRVSLVEVMQKLEADRAAIWRTGDDAELTRLTVQRDKLRRQVAELGQETQHWADLGAQQRALVVEIRDLEQRIAGCESEARTVEIAFQVRDLWRARADVRRQIDEIGPLDELPEGCIEQVDHWNEEIAAHRTTLQPLKKRRHEIRQELAAQPINQKLWDQSCRIEALCEHAPWMSSLDDEARRVRDEIEAAELELIGYDEQFVARGGVDVANAPIVTQRVVQQLAGPAQTLREALKKRALARKLHKTSRQEVEEAHHELSDHLQGRSAEDFEDAVEKAALLVKRLRRRVDIEDRLGHMWRQRNELQEEHGEKLDQQLRRVRILVAIGFMFVFGVVLVLTGAFGWNIMPMEAEISWAVAFLGLICVGLSAAWKTVLEKTTYEELQAVVRRTDKLEEEIELFVAERNELDRELPRASGTFSARLEIAEKDLRELEAMAPLHHDRQQASKRREVAKRRATNVDDELREARSRWRRGLRAAGLPESLSPKHIRQLGAHHQRKSKVETRLAELRERSERLTHDQQALLGRLRSLNQDVGMNTVSDDPQIQLSQLATALSGQRDMVLRRRELQREEKTLRREISQLLVKLRKAGRAREALFAEARVTDEEDLRDRQQWLETTANLRQQLQSLSEQIAAIVAGHCPEDDIAGELARHKPAEIQERLNRMLARLQDSQAHLKQLHERRGEVNQELKSLGGDRGLATARFQLGCVEEKIAASLDRWRASAATSMMLECIRETYEAERQPETLGEASLYLEQLTGGKYTRIWTPLGKNELRIDDRKGKPVSLDVLSRGTREAVFLSLRLALVAAYGRRGVTIPMILDDVLVNLDLARARNAVDVLCQFAAEGRQLLFFTCHDHIQKMFLDAAIDVRVLPAHGQPGIHIRPLTLRSPQPPVVAEEPAIELEVEPEPVAELVEEEPAEEPLQAALEPDVEYELADQEGARPRFDLASYLAGHDDEVADFDEEEEIEAELDDELEPEPDDEMEPEPVEPEPVAEVFEDRDDEPLEDGPWWWEPTARQVPQKESAA